MTDLSPNSPPDVLYSPCASDYGFAEVSAWDCGYRVVRVYQWGRYELDAQQLARVSGFINGHAADAIATALMSEYLPWD